MPSEGTKSSPIFISDDEDDEIQTLPRQMAGTSLSKPNQDNPIQGLPPRPTMAAKPRAKPANKVQNVVNGNSNEAARSKRKRKREQSSQSIDVANATNLTTSEASSSKSTNGSKNKKAKHSHRGRAEARRRAAEELAAAQTLSLSGNPQTSPFDSGYSANYPHSHFSPYDQDMQDPGYSSTIPDSDYYQMDSCLDDEDNYDHDYEMQLSSSDWVNSMARAADPPPPESTPISWEYSMLWPPPIQPYDPGPLQSFVSPATSLPPPPPMPTSHLPAPILQHPPLSEHTATSTAHKQPSTTTPLRKMIGIPSDRDSDGKRSGFKMSANTLFQSQPEVTYPHTPKPSHTLVLEQLPKQNRDPEFISSWAQEASGAAPVFFAVDSSSAKALVEFTNHQQARKAWSSPRLGMDLAGLPSSDLKGKPRTDLIRAWWYKPPSPELVFTRVELEEGEIEDEPVVETVKKESKKERKARVAKEVREEKEKRRETALQAAAILEEEKRVAKSLAAESMSASSAAVLPSVHPQLPPISYPPSYATVSWPAFNPYFLQHVAIPQHPLPSQAPDGSEEVFPPPNVNEITVDPAMGDLADDDVMSIDEPDSLVSEGGMDTEALQSLSPAASLLVPDQPDTDSPLSSNASPSKSSTSRTMIHPLPERPAKPAASPTAPPTHLPSEPRAMKNAPTAPTYTKRALVARQKELEERIARSKLELLQKMQGRSAVSNPSTEEVQQPQTPDLAPPPAPEEKKSEVVATSVEADGDVHSEVSPAKLIRENHLRNLVLASRRSKAAATDSLREGAAAKEDEPSNVSTPTPPDPSDYSKTVATDSSTTVVGNASTPVSRTPVAQTSLDDLAVSFITETIQTLQPDSGRTPTPLAASQAANSRPPPSASALAARQKQLEDKIAETKKLMERLARATNKQEKDNILASLRGLSRCVVDPLILLSCWGCWVFETAKFCSCQLFRSPNGNDVGSDPQTTSVSDTKDSAPVRPQVVSRMPSFSSAVKPVQKVQTINFECVWPTQGLLGGGVLILSDDEDEDE
ncbi:hypothetical protein PQX77_005226 [Marasmius sp. AFHP31]|nr:hypothetical protein PQX77_005226 [Marasmius sp. AFHP31]